MEKDSKVNCGLFHFMAHTVGIKVLHPGGYKSTDEICAMLHLDENSHVLDVACGSGTTAFYLAKKYGCKVTGFDISQELIDVANSALRKSNFSDKIKFDLADALEIPYSDNSFDVVISQALFILIDEKEKVLKEISRVLKPSGYFGALELSWFKNPSKDIYEELLIKTCNDLIPRVVEFTKWESFFRSENLTHINTIKHPMTSSMIEMFETEGIYNSLKIILKMLINTPIRTRMMNVQKYFGKYNDYLGYGIFCFQK